MSIIEGFGDELIYGMMVLLAIALVTACWFSTQIRTIPFINVFILEFMQDLVDSNAPHSDIVVSVTPEVPAEATSPPREDPPQTSETSDNVTEGVNAQQAEALKNDSETASTEESVEQKEKLSSGKTTPENDDASSDTQDSAEPNSEDEPGSSTTKDAPSLETRERTRKVNVKLIYTNTNTKKIVQTRLTDTIGDFRRLHFQKEILENKTIRFIFHGKCLANDRCTLKSCKVKRNSAIHCLVTSPTANHAEETVPNPTGRSLDISFDHGHEYALDLLLYPTILIVFAAFWYLQFTYELLSLYPCITSILGVSFFLLAMSVAIYRTMDIQLSSIHAHRVVYY